MICFVVLVIVGRRRVMFVEWNGWFLRSWFESIVSFLMVSMVI